MAVQRWLVKKGMKTQCGDRDWRQHDVVDRLEAASHTAHRRGVQHRAARQDRYGVTMRLVGTAHLHDRIGGERPQIMGIQALQQ